MNQRPSKSWGRRTRRGCGKSMGGRIASQMVAVDQMAVEALIFLGYPLHAPGRTDKLQDRHLY
jgi:hypothetical protein